MLEKKVDTVPVVLCGDTKVSVAVFKEARIVSLRDQLVHASPLKFEETVYGN